MADLDMINGKAMEELVTSPEHYLKVSSCKVLQLMYMD